MAMFNVGPVSHLASLMRGVDPYRKWDVDGSIGLTASWLTGETATPIFGKDFVLPVTDSDMKLGAHANLRLSYRFTNQASVFFMPTAYVLKNVNMVTLLLKEIVGRLFKHLILVFSMLLLLQSVFLLSKIHLISSVGAIHCSLKHLPVLL